MNGRSLSVCLDGFKSAVQPINASVPQGSVLAPTQFLIYINDLLSINSYADDSTLHTVVPRKGSGVSTRRLVATSINDDLSSIVSWGKSNLIDFNASKTNLMLILSRRDVNYFSELSMTNVNQSRESFNAHVKP